jgi:hypothetical protein
MEISILKPYSILHIPNKQKCKTLPPVNMDKSVEKPTTHNWWLMCETYHKCEETLNVPVNLKVCLACEVAIFLDT